MILSVSPEDTRAKEITVAMAGTGAPEAEYFEREKESNVKLFLVLWPSDSYIFIRNRVNLTVFIYFCSLKS